MTHSRYIVASWPAIAAGILAAAGSIALLIADGLKHQFTVDHALAPLSILLTVLAGHMILQALKEGKLLSVALLALVTVTGSGLVVYGSMGRQAANRDATTVVASAQMDDRKDLKADLKRSQGMLAEAQAAVAAEGAKGGCGPVCEGKKASVMVYENAVKGIKADLAKTPPVPVDPRADRIAGAALLAGATMSPEAIKGLVALLEPFAYPLFLEVCCFAFFGFGVRHVTETGVVLPASAVSFDVPAVKAVDFMERPPVKDLEEAKKYFTLSEDEAIIVEALRARGGKADRQGDLAQEVGCHPAELSKRVQACRPEAVMWQKVGRNKVLTLGSMVAGHA
jgi:hypothetical protein